jgi:hypothetical protein
VAEQCSSSNVLALKPILVLVSQLTPGMYVFCANFLIRGGIDDVIFRYDVSYLGSSRAQISKRTPDATCTFHDVSIAYTRIIVRGFPFNSTPQDTIRGITCRPNHDEIYLSGR